ncbi:ABC transporter substrate-binding protein [Oscillatoria sp. FACHB-1407]|uniref:ABC transporter substrate-binding protein n=1 Tax=Oscillatoria sp. FACHB-1407 TaxID=2692847 RepID=UPI001683E8DD|nr:ABC transporter substrate-binding protein [Oscillatoria sp. FACHB-1407]MBD2464318.1 ABC transporter substrate-binding protein [Oscillatoria sp. FACHB-1407]
MRRRATWFGVIGALLIGVAIALTGCNPLLLRTEAAQVPRLLLSVVSDPKTFNYVLNSESPNVFGYIYEGLIVEDGVTGEIQPALAESWEISPDNKRIVVTLKPNLRWSDGEPLTVEDVVFTYNDLYFNEAIPSSIRDVLRIGEGGALPQVRQVGDRQVEFSVPEPFAPLLRNLGLAILPAHALRESVETKDSQGDPLFISTWTTGTDPREIIGNGAYVLASYQPSQRVVFERNPYYWRSDNQGNAQPYIDQVVWQIVESTDASLMQFRSGGLDVLSITPDLFALLKREEERGNFTLYEGGPAAGTNFIAFNLNQGRRNGKPLVDPIKSRWFNTLEFRQAVAHAIDRQRMVNNTFQGLAQLQNSPISVQSPYYLPPEEGLPVYDYDPERSRQLLVSAGFQYNTVGQLLDADGNLVRFTLITNAGNKVRESMGAQVKQDLAKIGIQVDFEPIAFNTLLNKLGNTVDWECYLLGFTGGIEPNSGANVWLPNGRSHRFNQAAQPGQPPIEGRVVSDWEQRIADLYIQGAKTLDETQRKAIYAESQRITQENLPFIYLVNPLSLAAVRDRLSPIKFSALNGPLWNIHELELEEE